VSTLDPHQLSCMPFFVCIMSNHAHSVHSNVPYDRRCMSGVVLGPHGVIFVGEPDRPELEDMSHLTGMSVQSALPTLNAASQISTVLCKSEKEQVEAWRIAASATMETTGGDKFSPILGANLTSDIQAETSCSVYSMPKPMRLRCRGLTFIADVENHCIHVVRADGKHVRRFGALGKEKGQFNALQGLFVDDECAYSDDDDEKSKVLIYVADTSNHRIQVLELSSVDASDMKVRQVIGQFGKEDGSFNYPVGLTLDREDPENKRLIVADTGNDRIQIFTTQGEHVRSIGILGKHETNAEQLLKFREKKLERIFHKLESPSKTLEDLWKNFKNKKALEELQKNRQLSGKNPKESWITSSFSWREISDTQPTNGRKLANVDLAEALRDKHEFTQQEWDKFGIVDLRTDDFIKSGESFFQPAAINLEELERETLEGMNSELQNPEQERVNPGLEKAKNEYEELKNAKPIPHFKLPYDILVMAGLIYVTDHGNHRIQVLTMDGEHVRSLGSSGTKTGKFVHPRGLMRGPTGHLLISDQVF
jgi:hypothetical protein